MKAHSKYSFVSSFFGSTLCVELVSQSSFIFVVYTILLCDSTMIYLTLVLLMDVWLFPIWGYYEQCSVNIPACAFWAHMPEVV